MSTNFLMTRDQNGYNGFGLAFSDNNYAGTLATGVEQHFTVPNAQTLGGQGDNFNQFLAVFSIEPGARVWVANNATAAVATGTLATSTSQFNPTARLVKGGDVLSFITPDVTADVGISLYVI